VKPLWKEGLFIMPQHLQVFDDYHEELLDRRMSALDEFCWGVSELEINEDELARGMFSIHRCTAVLPDGLLVTVGPDQPMQGVQAMTSGSLIGGGQATDVYLSVPGTDDKGNPNYVGDGSAGGTRFIHSVDNVSDAYGGASVAEVDSLRPNVQLLLGHENRQNYVSVKIAELTLAESGALSVSDTYIPPCLKVRCSPPLMDWLSRTVAAMRAKQKNLAEKYGGRVAGMVEFGAADVATFWYLHTLNTWLPVFMHYAKSAHVHPERLYTVLVSLAGQLTTFETGDTPEDFPPFNFLDLSSSFKPLFDKILKLLGTVISERYKVIDLEQTQPGLFVGKVTDPQLLRSHRLYLLAGGDVPENTLKSDLPRYLKIASLDQIAQVVQAALPGVKANIDLSPPNAIPIRGGHVYLNLDKTGNYWNTMVQSGSIAIYQPISPDRVTLQLLAVEG